MVSRFGISEPSLSGKIADKRAGESLHKGVSRANLGEIGAES
jgi:hypothetical protein